MESSTLQIEFAGIAADKNVKQGVWTKIKAYREDTKATGGLMLKAQACVLLEITDGRMSQLVKDGRFTLYTHFGKEMVGADEIVEYARIKKISGTGGAKQKAAWKATKAGMKADIEIGLKNFKKSTTSG